MIHVHSENEKRGVAPKTAILVDVQNIYYTVREIFNSHFDYSRFYSQASAGREVFKARAYATSRDDRNQKHFQSILKQIGFEVMLIPYIQRRDGSAKGNWDIGISLDILEYAPDIDVLVLATGDGDYAPVIEKVTRECHVDVEVYGVRKLTALSLIMASTRFIPIDAVFLLPIPEK